MNILEKHPQPWRIVDSPNNRNPYVADANGIRLFTIRRKDRSQQSEDHAAAIRHLIVSLVNQHNAKASTDAARKP